MTSTTQDPFSNVFGTERGDGALSHKRNTLADEVKEAACSSIMQRFEQEGLSPNQAPRANYFLRTALIALMDYDEQSTNEQQLSDYAFAHLGKFFKDEAFREQVTYLVRDELAPNFGDNGAISSLHQRAVEDMAMPILRMLAQINAK